MEQTPLPPLLTDEKIDIYASKYIYPTSRESRRSAEWVREIYEADRIKTREVVQETVNALHGLCHGPMSMEDAADAALAALALAKSQLNIEPTKP